MSFKTGDRVKIVSVGTAEGRERRDLRHHIGDVGLVRSVDGEVVTVLFQGIVRRVHQDVLQSANEEEPQPVTTAQKSADKKEENGEAKN